MADSTTCWSSWPDGVGLTRRTRRSRWSTVTSTRPAAWRVVTNSPRACLVMPTRAARSVTRMPSVGVSDSSRRCEGRRPRPATRGVTPSSSRRRRARQARSIRTAKRRGSSSPRGCDCWLTEVIRLPYLPVVRLLYRFPEGWAMAAAAPAALDCGGALEEGQCTGVVSAARGRPVRLAGFRTTAVAYEPGSPATGALLRVTGATADEQPWSVFLKVLQHPRHWSRLGG